MTKQYKSLIGRCLDKGYRIEVDTEVVVAVDQLVGFIADELDRLFTVDVYADNCVYSDWKKSGITFDLSE